jgi:hypothetical protein
MDDFESIHACLPKLDSISLEMVNLIINDTPTVIYPATTVKTLSLFFHDVHVDSQIQWLWYIYKKYTQLSHHEFSNFNKHFWKPDTVADISMHGFLPLIQGLGRRLESFKTPSIPLDTSLFKHFDQSGCQIHTLNCFSIDEELLVRSLTQSYQGFHIQKLTLRDITPFPVELLRNLPSLKSLEMIYKYNRDDHYRLRCSEIDLNQVLKACPTTLESLHLEKALFDCDASSSDIYGIKSLTLVCPLLPRQMDKFLSNSLPKLRSLTLKGCIPCGATLNLPNHNLSYLEIVTRDWKASTFISKTTLNDAQNSFYAIKGTGISTDDLATTVDNIDFFGHIAAKPVAYKDLEHCTFTKIICGSVQTLIINNYLVC